MASFVRYMDESILPKRLWLIRQTRDTFRGNATLSSDPKSCKQMKSAACWSMLLAMDQNLLVGASQELGQRKRGDETAGAQGVLMRDRYAWAVSGHPAPDICHILPVGALGQRAGARLIVSMKCLVGGMGFYNALRALSRLGTAGDDASNMLCLSPQLRKYWQLGHLAFRPLRRVPKETLAAALAGRAGGVEYGVGLQIRRRRAMWLASLHDKGVVRGCMGPLRMREDWQITDVSCEGDVETDHQVQCGYDLGQGPRRFAVNGAVGVAVDGF
ncbi:hypothetical protein C8034_v009478 [Colletotrichum sidae]|uniref:Uncharacterized protein n=1 Tax=Colletotrichum sidae TaxID=1347389 RepID=A0A4R8TL46_9PEZI|nr:hypothetical protein C8034_v009478 [Colletotrichum sidae]